MCVCVRARTHVCRVAFFSDWPIRAGQSLPTTLWQRCVLFHVRRGWTADDGARQMIAVTITSVGPALIGQVGEKYPIILYVAQQPELGLCRLVRTRNARCRGLHSCILYTHTHTHTYIYIYMCVCVCVCVCVWCLTHVICHFSWT